MLNARLETAVCRELHPLHDLRWGDGGIMFGCSRRIADRTFSDLTGWHPHVTPAVESL